jgi:hypothetical protein
MNIQKEKKRLASLETLRSQLLKIVLLFVEAVGEDEENNFGKAFDLYKKARTEIELVSCRLLINPKIFKGLCAKHTILLGLSCFCNATIITGPLIDLYSLQESKSCN